MRGVSTAIALVLALAGAGLIASPVAAQDKAEKPAKVEKPKKEKKPKKGEEPKADAKPSVSPEFGKAMQPYDAAFKASNWAAAKAAVDAAKALAKTPYEKFIAGQYLTNLGVQSKNDPDLYAGLDQMVDSGFVPPEGLGQRAFFSGNQAYREKNYAKAVQRLTLAAQNNYFKDNTLLLLTFAYTDQNKLDEAAAAARQFAPKMAATDSKGAKSVYERVAESYRQADRPKETFEFLRMSLKLGADAPTWRKYLNILIQNGNYERETDLDIRRLMDVAGALTERADFLSYGIDAVEEGLPTEALSAIERGVAAGKLSLAPSTGQPNLAKETADKARSKIADETASLPASERDSSTAKTGRTARFTGDVFYSRGDYAKAVALYRIALQKGEATKPDFANIVNTRLGSALYKSGDMAGAKAAFQTITGARTELAKFWLAYIDFKENPPTVVAPAPAAAPTKS
jgi:lipopolysaccharide biosynthesis regulator YciM